MRVRIHTFILSLWPKLIAFLSRRKKKKQIDWALYMTVRHHRATWVVQVQKNVAGKTVSLCQIYVTPKEVSDGHRAPFKVSIIS